LPPIFAPNLPLVSIFAPFFCPKILNK